MIRNLQKLSQFVPDLDLEDVLGYFGLERRRSSVLPTFGALAVGMLAGAGVALLLAPSSGKELRADLERKLADLRDRQLPRLVDQAFDHAKAAGRELAHEAQGQPNSSLHG